MALITVLLTLIIEHFLGSMAELRRFGWFNSCSRWLRGRLPDKTPWDGPLGVLLVLAVPVLLLGLAAYFLWQLWSPLGFLFSVLVLLYSFGPRDLAAEVEAFVDASERGDEEAAQWHAAELLGGESPTNSQALIKVMMENILVEANERLLGVIFWFVLLGPVGALLYRLAGVLKHQQLEDESGFAQAARRLHYILAWLPARVCALGYALSGSFEGALHLWHSEAEKWPDQNRGVLVASGLGALHAGVDDDPEAAAELGIDDIQATMALVRRTVLVWLVVLALLTLTGWG